MHICSKHEPTFWMDLHGELGPVERAVWNEHLSACGACREEKALAIRMMGHIRDALTPQPLSNAALTVMVSRIAEESQKRKVPFPAPKRRRLVPAVVFPALATACVLLAIGVFSLVPYFTDSSEMNVPIADLNTALPMEDLEIIENMELLTDFETLEQLVQMGEDQSSPPPTDEQIQGKANAQGELTYG